VLSDVLIIAGSVLAAVAFLLLVTRASEAHFRKESNDFTGAVVAVIGTTYAVILAFMLSGVWNLFQQAQVNEEQEANDVINVFRIGAQLPDADRIAMQGLARDYVERALNVEWPAFERGEIPPDGISIIRNMWNVAGQAEAHSRSDEAVVSQLMTEISKLTGHRRTRITHAKESLPPILWLVLIAGGVITVAAACLFGVANFRFHLLQVLVLSFLLSLVLVAIADIDQPYRGAVKVDPEGFRYAQQTIAAESTR
jgi:hypothetical protein